MKVKLIPINRKTDKQAYEYCLKLADLIVGKA